MEAVSATFAPSASSVPTEWIPTPFLAQEYDTIDGYRDNSQLEQGEHFQQDFLSDLGWHSLAAIQLFPVGLGRSRVLAY